MWRRWGTSDSKTVRDSLVGAGKKAPRRAGKVTGSNALWETRESQEVFVVG